jgi:hypothetical protein
VRNSPIATNSYLVALRERDAFPWERLARKRFGDCQVNMKKWAVRVGVGLVCTGVATVTLFWCVPPAPRLTPENIAKLDADTTEADVVELFGRPYFKGPFENGGQNVVWIEEKVLFGVRLDDSGKVVGIRWEKDVELEGFWHKLRRRLRL